MAFRNLRTKAHTCLLSLCSFSLLLALGAPVADASVAMTTHHQKSPAPYPIAVNQQMTGGVPFVQGAVQGAPSIVSQSAVVMDLSTGTLVYAKDPLATHYPASITKIMTAMLALEHGKLTDKLTVTPLAASQPADNLDLVPGEVESLQAFLYALLLYSANDSAVVIAQHYGGSVQGFADMMNAKARSLGAVHTHFVNPNGLPNPNHVTTAYDMALIARAAMQIPEFRTIVATTRYPWDGTKWQTTLYNINHFLTTYPGAIGLKTGYTSVAHETLVVAATHGGQTFLAVLMDAPTDYSIRQDAANLMNFAFAHYKTVTVLPAHHVLHATVQPKSQPIPISTQSAVLATVPIGTALHVVTHSSVDLQAGSIKKGTQVGVLQLITNGQVIGKVPLMSDITINPPVLRRPITRFDIALMIVLLFVIARMSQRVFRSRLTPPSVARRSLVVKELRNYGVPRMEQD